MSELFGLSMNTIMAVLVGLLALSALAMALVFVRGRMMFRMGVRNVRRRRAQSVLVIAGLMLATVMITAAFTTGDTLDHSITRVTYDFLQRTDLSLHHFQAADGQQDGTQFYARDDLASRLDAAFADDPDIEGFVPFLFEPVPVRNEDSGQSEPNVILAGIDATAMAAFGGIRLSSGNPADVSALGPDEVFANTRAADMLDVEAGDRLAVYVEGEPRVVTVVGIVHEERATGGLEFGGGEVPGIAAPLATVQALTGHEGQINSVSVVLRGGVRGSVSRSDAAAERLEAFIATDAGKQQLGLGTAGFQVEKVKQDAIEAAKLAASGFTTIFLVLGLFSIASGVLLIFMIFVMLAAERRREMGITRAVGALRIHLIQAFLAEGVVYALLAGVAGVILGVGFGLAVIVGGSKLAFGDDLAFISAYVTPRTLVVSFCLGSVVTFATVVSSSVVVSRLNIVAAIRGQVAAESRATNGRVRARWILLGALLTLLAPPVGLYLLLRRGIGLSRTWAAMPVALGFAAVLIPVGRMLSSSFLFSSGISLLILGIVFVARKWHAPERVAWTAGGLALCLYWLLPFNISEKLFGSFDNTGMEMFVLSGIMIVTALTLIVVFNARSLTAMYGGASRGRRGYVIPAAILTVAAVLAAVGRVTDDLAGGVGQIAYLGGMILVVAAAFAFVAQRYPHLAPALRMGIAYPLANRFRTGMTIAMFSLILFSMTVMSVINASFLKIFAGDEGTGGWDVYVASNRNNPITDLRASASDAGIDMSDVAGVGAMTAIDDDRQSVRQGGMAGADWEKYIVRAADDEFWDVTTTSLEARATGYASDRAVFDAIHTQPGLAIIEAGAMVEATFGVPAFKVEGVTIENEQFEPFTIEIRNEATAAVASVTVVGVFSGRIPTGLYPGLMISSETSRALFGNPDYRDFVLKLSGEGDSQDLAKAIEAGMATSGVQAFSIEKVIQDALASSRGFLRVMQLFMGLGLVVGIAAIGVISLRSVVERRQQIGMLRAIGYERGTVAMGFLFESAFIALMGVGSGVVGAVLLSRNLMDSPDFTGAEGIALFVPWVEVLIAAGAAFVFALLMTWWPSRIAADVPVAEALRYE